MGYFHQAVKGTGWMGGLRLIIRLVALLKLAILARILVPSQFGLFGIASLVVAFLETLTETGINVFLIQDEGDIEEYIDTAWVVSIVRGILIASIIVLSAPLVAIFFSSKDSFQLLLLIALVPFLRGFINPAIVKLQKELQFHKQFIVQSVVVVFEAAITIFLALRMRSVESLIFGMIGGALLEIAISFLLIRPRPKLALEKTKTTRIIGRGKWITAAGFFNYLFHHGDDIVVGKLLGTTSLGLYQMAYKISTLPITEVADVFGKVTFPIFTRISGDTERLRKAFVKTTVGITLLVLPFGIFLFLFPNQVIAFVFGEQWLIAAPALQLLAIFGVIRAISGSSSALFLAVKKQEYVTGLTLVSILGLAVTIVPLVNRYGILGAAASATIGALAALPVIGYYLRRVFSDVQTETE
ncbi:MAG: hypothetical protein A2900_03860 [Candidatus Chisholmbacteria bacterium RIFCSPLOWO2_01_FULL_50_28]|uniref:Polysaccharide biosynthesis protein C-terminal domain-containing protein n=1 Tax=Candidatus Chisholmbacteria bacterium RIFCSPHIGHO2_01_FULL_52_32 TaxID=1797591 RepID=A0A1G1VST5_9BACT|nr:MAG: hypothetical protein A2786_02885 [Candidatus Chisholmbacteria bacterium RIFCSPHIGHO2_01_FULL_52_32]OGY20209.1 MAG: hypothetical protein A2900_03860 [Candidatus Chisholmbacteria bacterium RIFCSPLOWO2_01_FULL_50_28]